METFRNLTLIIHVGCGFLALALGFAAILFKKGQKRHRFSGKLFFRAMLGVTLSALIISGITENYFLFVIGIFSFFQNYFGYRSVKNKSLIPNVFDWIVLIIASLNSVAMLISMNIVLVVFGVISTFLAIGQARIFFKIRLQKDIPKIQWLVQHIGMMLGAYIATLTAFLVVNFPDVEPGWLIWISPSIIGGSLIFYYTRSVTRRNENIPFATGQKKL